MMAARVEIRQPDEETLELYIDGKYMMSADKDRHGWSGMNLFNDTVVVMATMLGITFEVFAEGE